MNFILTPIFYLTFFSNDCFLLFPYMGVGVTPFPHFYPTLSFLPTPPLPVPFQEELVGIGYTSYFTFTGNNSSPFFLISPPFINFILLGNIYIFLRISANFAAILSNFAYISRNSQIFYLLFLLILFSISN